MAMTLETKSQRPEAGFALLIAVIFMSVMLSFGLALGSLSYKQQVLASSAVQSQYAFYAADAGLECALYADQRDDRFAYPLSDPSSVPQIICDNSPVYSSSKQWFPSSPQRWIIMNTLQMDTNRCVDVTVYKYKDQQPPDNLTTYIFSQGYDVSCATVVNPNGMRFVARGVQIHY
jgi:hypothetical protein